MKIALTGLAFAGKSTVFRALVGKQTQTKSFASGKGQLNIGTLTVNEPRLKRLAELVGSQKVTYPNITLVDLVGLAEARSRGIEANYIREFDLLALVIGLFSSVSPLTDLGNVESELILADMQIIQNRIARINKESKAKPQKEEDPELLLLKRCARALEEGGFVKRLELTSEELNMLAGFGLLTLKPVIAVANISEEQLKNRGWTELEEKAQERGLKFLSLCAKLEAEIEELTAEERSQFLQELGLAALSRDRFIQLAFQALRMILFFTVVGKEARAWPIRAGSTALAAAGCVHSDMERGFIRAEVINYNNFVECGSFSKAKEQGLLRLESKEYPVTDGDIINFKFSV